MIISSWSSNCTRDGGISRIDPSAGRGTVSVRPFRAPEDIAGLTLTETFKEYVRYHPIIFRKESLARAAALPDANVVLAVSDDKKIVGFAILKYPAPDERWARVGDRVMMELAVVEVGREWRGTGVGKTLLRMAL
jgi:acetoin utilization protein AcuA